MKFLLIGGTGFIGHTVAENVLLKGHDVCVFSRSEANQHHMRVKFSSYLDKMEFYVGDIKDKYSIRKCMKLYKPNIVIVSAATKRIDVCEHFITEAVSINVTGLENVCEAAIEEDSITHILYTSTDKASDPINVYGATKAIGEKIMLDYSRKFPNKNFCVTRYGNVLESTGSVIPIFKDLISRGRDINLRGTNMTRFILDKEYAFETIWYALFQAEPGVIVIPKCKAMNVKDLAEIMSERSESETNINIVEPLPYEKIDEALISENESKYISFEDEKYYILNPFKIFSYENKKYTSDLDVFSKKELEEFLVNRFII